jgi:hypothetical protein
MEYTKSEILNVATKLGHYELVFSPTESAGFVEILVGEGQRQICRWVTFCVATSDGHFRVDEAIKSFQPSACKY